MSAAIAAGVFVWHDRGTVLEVDLVLGGGGRLLATIRDRGQGAGIELEPRAIGELARALAVHVREHGIETGDRGIDDLDGLEVDLDEMHERVEYLGAQLVEARARLAALAEALEPAEGEGE